MNRRRQQLMRSIPPIDNTLCGHLSYKIALSGYTMKFLGKGSYGVVYQLTSQTSGKTFAVKMFEQQTIPDPTDPTDPRKRRQIPDDTYMIEADILRLLSENILLPELSPHLALYLSSGNCLDVNGKRNGIIISEFMDGGTLYSTLENHIDTIKNLTIQKKIIGKIIDFMNVLLLSTQQFVFTMAEIRKLYPYFRHNDSKPNNILISHSRHRR